MEVAGVCPRLQVEEEAFVPVVVVRAFSVLLVEALRKMTPKLVNSQKVEAHRFVSRQTS